MLRWEVGDSTFFNILKEYFNKYKFSSASTSDFIEVCENVNGRNLKKFFHQWIEGEGEIELEYESKTTKVNNYYKTKIRLEQVQEEYQYYEFPIEVLLKFEGGEYEYYKYSVKSELTLFEIKSDGPVLSVELDPNGWLLASIYHN
jgi:aminopeptidase N